MTGMLHKPSEADVHARLISVIFVPPNVDFERILVQSGSRRADRARYFTHVLCKRILYRNRKHHDKRPEGVPESAVRLKAKYIRKHIGRGYKRILSDLEAAGVIQVYRRATKGKSYYYWFGPAILTQTFQAYFPRCGYVMRRIVNTPSPAPEDLECVNRRYVCQQLPRLIVDWSLALGCLSEMNNHAKFVGQNSLARIADGSFTWTHDAYGRLHHNYTNQSKQLRPALLVDGENLCELDIPNSQPTFLGVACVLWLRNGKNLESFSDLNLQNLEDGKEETTTTPIPHPILCAGLGEIPATVKHYLDCCCTGRFYETLGQALFGRPLQASERDEFKERIFGNVLYAKKTYNDNRYVDAFKSLFPVVFELIDQTRKLSGAGASGVLQRIEAQFIFDRVVARLIQERPGIFITTIHDAILVKHSDGAYASTVMSEEFQRIGIEVIPRVKRYGE